MPLVKKSVGIQFYVDVENQKESACKVISKTKTCILDKIKRDCDIFETSSAQLYTVEPKENMTFISVLPTLFQHDLIGYVDCSLEYQCGRTRNKTMFREPFNTKVYDQDVTSYLLKDYIENENVKECSEIDENSLNDCNPADCDQKYLGMRSFYNDIFKKCMPVTTCGGDPSKELPEAALLVVSNTCRDLDSPLTLQDIYAISTGLGTTIVTPSESPNRFKIEVTSNLTTISQNLKFLRDLALGKLCSLDESVDVSAFCKLAFVSIAISVTLVCCGIICLSLCLNTIVCICSEEYTRKRRYWPKIKNAFNLFDIRQKSKSFDDIKENRNSLLREVMVRDIPIELRNNVIDLCKRIDDEIKDKKRYKATKVRSHVNLEIDNEYRTSSPTNTSTSIEANDNKNRLH
ncbi:hypothetical protein RR48_04766 [Papilio machaon]|uniref:Uncharacterized protein n=1 Tax=Papilio machaon TaxID=76193 RepID=A0A0N1IQ09_PAPMA|nr:hypothetical protein RR48_04766 [Papilio machaon]